MATGEKTEKIRKALCGSMKLRLPLSERTKCIMGALIAIFGSLLVAFVGIAGQFFISSRSFIPKIREERAIAYSSFLAACLTGMYAVTIDKQI